MKIIYFLLILLGLAIIAGCNQGETMVLLDEEVTVINISTSNGFGEMNDQTLHSFSDASSIYTIKGAILSSVKKKVNMDTSKPDYDIMVEYGEDFPIHAIHLWLGDEDEPSTMMYMVDDEVTTYLTTSKTTNQLRELLLEH